LGEKLVVLQAVAGGCESRALRRPDVARELPKRHSLRCREAIADLGRRKAGRKEEAVLIDRRSVEGVPARRFEQPASLLERRLARPLAPGAAKAPDSRSSPRSGYKTASSFRAAAARETARSPRPRWRRPKPAPTSS